jgi:hypothetical protein
MILGIVGAFISGTLYTLIDHWDVFAIWGRLYVRWAVDCGDWSLSSRCGHTTRSRDGEPTHINSEFGMTKARTGRSFGDLLDRID